MYISGLYPAQSSSNFIKINAQKFAAAILFFVYCEVKAKNVNRKQLIANIGAVAIKISCSMS
jgi:hypothetical protein